MCRKLKAISQNTYGEFYHCNSCNVYHMLFNNFYLILNQEQFYSLKNYIINMDVTYLETQYECTTIKRKISIPTCQENLILIFNKQEFDAFKRLFYKTSNRSKILSVEEIEYNYILN
jgi:hypothetical protein